MKVDLLAATFQHGTAEVVVEQDTRKARPVVKGVDMPA
jgi:hypothetical protein